jgi:hypothetical protein
MSLAESLNDTYLRDMAHLHLCIEKLKLGEPVPEVQPLAQRASASQELGLRLAAARVEAMVKEANARKAADSTDRLP